MKKTTRVLSGLIAVIILLSALSVSVSAYTERTYQGMKYTKYDSLDGDYRDIMLFSFGRSRSGCFK